MKKSNRSIHNKRRTRQACKPAKKEIQIWNKEQGNSCSILLCGS